MGQADDDAVLALTQKLCRFTVPRGRNNYKQFCDALKYRLLPHGHFKDIVNFLRSSIAVQQIALNDICCVNGIASGDWTSVWWRDGEFMMSTQIGLIAHKILRDLLKGK